MRYGLGRAIVLFVHQYVSLASARHRPLAWQLTGVLCALTLP